MAFNFDGFLKNMVESLDSLEDIENIVEKLEEFQNLDNLNNKLSEADKAKLNATLAYFLNSLYFCFFYF